MLKAGPTKLLNGKRVPLLPISLFLFYKMIKGQRVHLLLIRVRIFSLDILPRRLCQTTPKQLEVETFP